MTETTEMPAPTDTAGAFRDSLVRSNRKIRADRADAIVEDAETIFRRTIEDLRLNIKRMKRERENMLDLSPETSMSLVLASDFDAKEYVSKELELGVSIRNDEIKLEIAEARYLYLFGGRV
jgi:hypothetical protein